MKAADLKSLPSLSIPISNLRIAGDPEGNLKIFDIIRKKFVNLTPEEWVRQNFVHWLVEHKDYPVSLISNETEFKLNDTRKRCDTVVFGRTCEPLMIIEYKAPDVEITQNTFEQIVRYNMILKAKYLIVSNGIRTYCCVVDYNRNRYDFIPEIPEFSRAAGAPSEN